MVICFQLHYWCFFEWIFYPFSYLLILFIYCLFSITAVKTNVYAFIDKLSYWVICWYICWVYQKYVYIKNIPILTECFWNSWFSQFLISLFNQISICLLLVYFKNQFLFICIYACVSVCIYTHIYIYLAQIWMLFLMVNLHIFVWTLQCNMFERFNPRKAADTSRKGFFRGNFAEGAYDCISPSAS